MNIYEKLQIARCELQNSGLKKSGMNKFSGYDYFELSDFLPRINELFAKHKLCSIVSFQPDLATLTIIDSEKPESTIVITSPMADANLKGCHPIQNMGAVETYGRRYLYMIALEIIEHDILDSTHDQNAPTSSRTDKAHYHQSDKMVDAAYPEIEFEMPSKMDGPTGCGVCFKKHINKGDIIVKVGGKFVGSKECYIKQQEGLAKDRAQVPAETPDEAPLPEPPMGAGELPYDENEKPVDYATDNTLLDITALMSDKVFVKKADRDAKERVKTMMEQGGITAATAGSIILWLRKLPNR